MEDNKNTCANCRRELDVGVDAIESQAGVIGLKGFVPLGEILFFCCDRCISEHFDLSDLPKKQPRIP